MGPRFQTMERNKNAIFENEKVQARFDLNSKCGLSQPYSSRSSSDSQGSPESLQEMRVDIEIFPTHVPAIVRNINLRAEFQKTSPKAAVPR